MLQRTYLIAAITLFLLLLVPYFQNLGIPDLLFLNGSVPYTTALWLFVVGGMILGYLITILTQGFIQDIKDTTNKNKFEM